MNFVEEYQKQINYGLSQIDPHLYYQTLEIFYDLHSNRKTLYVAGNGGSAAIANHLVCDCFKGPKNAFNNIKVISLVSNMPLITAISNDIHYKDVFMFQLHHLLDPGDAVLLISSSGNSDNIILAAEFVRYKKNRLIGFTGFNGGKLKLLSDINFHIPVNNYGVIEDCHQAIMHMLSQMYYSKEHSYAV